MSSVLNIPHISPRTGRHYYTSTACAHAQHEPDKYPHDRCRKTCKFCHAPCQCSCHITPGRTAS